MIAPGAADSKLACPACVLASQTCCVLAGDNKTARTRNVIRSSRKPCRSRGTENSPDVLVCLSAERIVRFSSSLVKSIWGTYGAALPTAICSFRFCSRLCALVIGLVVGAMPGAVREDKLGLPLLTLFPACKFLCGLPWSPLKKNGARAYSKCMASCSRLCHAGQLLNFGCRIESGSWRRACGKCIETYSEGLEIPAGRCRLLTESCGTFGGGRNFFVVWSTPMGPIDGVRALKLKASDHMLLVFVEESVAIQCEEGLPKGSAAHHPPAPCLVRMHYRVRILVRQRSCGWRATS